jgi:hypothetical protein
MRETIEANLRRVRERIEQACRRAGRRSDEVTIVGVTKTFGPEVVDALVEAGVEHIGENRIQEFLGKKPLVTRPCRWHLVGTLQRNKATKAVGQFELIHSVDRLALAETLSRLGEERGVTTQILLEVNTSGESTKRGLAPDELVDAAGQVVTLPGLSCAGLMTVGPLTDDPAAIRRSFEMLRNLGDRIETVLGKRPIHLSMGMSDDFETAVEEGATMVRLGRVLLGERHGAAPPGWR